MKRFIQYFLAAITAVLLFGCATEQTTQPITLNESVLFARDSATLKKESGKVLDKVAVDLKQSDNKFTVQGHTDSTGTDAINMKLSQKRADAVKAALVKRGVQADRIMTKGYGSSMPVVKGAKTAADHQKNRRVVIACMSE